jgi:hypothetical protein
MAGYAIKAAADFDKAMSGVQAATHAGANEIGALRQAALQAGKDTQYSATQAAQGITELSKAGVSTADVLGGGLKGALNLAAAGQLDVGEAAETAATAMTQFGLSGKDIPHVADLLAAGAGKAQGSVHDMGYALKQSGLVAAQFGLSVEDTTGTLAAFASAGLIGSDAGTSFKTMLLALANPSAKTKDAMDELGISAYDAQGKFVGIRRCAEQLQDEARRPDPGAARPGPRPDLRYRRDSQRRRPLQRRRRGPGLDQEDQRRRVRDQDRRRPDQQPVRRPRAAEGLARDPRDPVRLGRERRPAGADEGAGRPGQSGRRSALGRHLDRNCSRRAHRLGGAARCGMDQGPRVDGQVPRRTRSDGAGRGQGERRARANDLGGKQGRRRVRCARDRRCVDQLGVRH